MKYNLPDGKVVDILSNVTTKILPFIQTNSEAPESGGYIIGYKHKYSGNIILEDVSTPGIFDENSRIHFKMVDPIHCLFLKRKKYDKSYYMGVWHTHPQEVPVPSSIDWEDWYETLKTDKTACDYIFFLIAGTKKIRIWVGNIYSKKIVELLETKKVDELYIK